MKYVISGGVVSLSLLLTACRVGPDYHRPLVSLPVTYKESQGWQKAEPLDALSKGDWWMIYRDPVLNQLLPNVVLSNQNIAMYEAKYRQALALVAGAQAARFPDLNINGQGTRSASTQSIANSYSTGLQASWQLDLWGKLRRQQRENQAEAEASAAQLANATLSAQAELAQNYFKLRVMDQQIALDQQSIQIYQDSLRIVNNRYQAGLATLASVAQAQQQVASTRSNLENVQWQRAQLEHAIALLAGTTPAQFHLPAAPLQAHLPTIPTSLPASLLQRRPDIAAAERSVAAANEQIGIAISGYYPDLSISASGGFSSSVLHNLLTLPQRVWSLGPQLSGTVLDFGATTAKKRQAEAAYDASVASYRQTVLQAIGEVEDNLVQLQSVSHELVQQRAAVEAAKTSARVTRNQYLAGKIDYLDVVTTENSQLSEKQKLLSLESSQWVASVNLVKALGGGYHYPD